MRVLGAILLTIGSASIVVIAQARTAAPVRNVYVSDQSAATVLVYEGDGSSNRVVRTIGGFQLPTGLALDGDGNLYVADANANAVLMFAPGASTPSMRYTRGLADPVAVTVAPDGRIWVCNNNGTVQGSVVVFAPGNNRPVRRLGGPAALAVFGGGSPSDVAVDRAGNAYVVYTNADASLAGVKKFGPRDNRGLDQGIRTGSPYGIRLDAAGNYVVSEQLDNDVLVYAPQTTRPERRIGVREAFNIDFSADYSMIYDVMLTSVSAYDYRTGRRLFTITQGLQSPGGIAVAPAAVAR